MTQREAALGRIVARRQRVVEAGQCVVETTGAGQRPTEVNQHEGAPIGFLGELGFGQGDVALALALGRHGVIAVAGVEDAEVIGEPAAQLRLTRSRHYFFV